jgi:hypothetical protein
MAKGASEEVRRIILFGLANAVHVRKGDAGQSRGLPLTARNVALTASAAFRVTVFLFPSPRLD